MLNLGGKPIKDLYLGGVKIGKAYLGDKLVYQADNTLKGYILEFYNGEDVSDVTNLDELLNSSDLYWSRKGKITISDNTLYLHEESGSTHTYYIAIDDFKIEKNKSIYVTQYDLGGYGIAVNVYVYFI